MAVIPISAIIVLIVLVTLITIKTILFFKNIRFKKFKYWIYFNKSHVINSSSEISEKAKRQQNLLTVIIAAVFFIECIMAIMVYKFN